MSRSESIEDLNATADILVSIFGDQLQNGASPESLRDMGYAVPDGAFSVPSHPWAFQDEEEHLQNLATMVTPEDHIKPDVRRDYLYQAIDTAGKLRRIHALITHSKAGPKDIGRAKNAHRRYTESFGESLARACGACTLQGDCRLEGKPGAWLDRHPPGLASSKQQEGIKDYRNRLEVDPTACCVPPQVSRTAVPQSLHQVA